MSLWSAISRLMTVVAVMGLVVGALSAPVKGEAAHRATLAMAAAEAMPCCNALQSAPDDCGDMQTCPFATACSMKCPPGAFAAAAFLSLRVAVAKANAWRSDRHGDGIATRPLGHPPKA